MSYKTEKPYINATYYTGAYKPELNARIEGPYNNVKQHQENFDGFRERASWLVNRLNQGEIENLGGIDLVGPKAQAWNMKATASLVEYWYLNDYKLGDIDAAFSTGNVSISRKKTNGDVKQFIPETTRSFVQLGGLITGNSVKFINTRYTGNGYQGYGNKYSNLITPNDYFTKEEARAIFQPAGQFDNNFHKAIDIQGELTGIDQDKYFKIAEADLDGQDVRDVTFSVIGGLPNEAHQAKYFISVVAQDANNISITESGVISLNTNAADPNTKQLEFLARMDNNVMSVWIKSKDFDITNFLISDIAADNVSLFDNFGSQTDVPAGADIINLENAISGSADINNLQAQVDDNTARIVVLENNTADLPQIRNDISSNTTLATNAANDASVALANSVKAENDAAQALSESQQALVEANSKLPINQGIKFQGNVLQVDNQGNLVPIALGTLQQILGIDVDDNVLATISKRYNTAINELLGSKVEYRNKTGQNFKLDGINDTTYDLTDMETNAEAIKALFESLDNLLQGVGTKAIDVSPAIDGVSSGNNGGTIVFDTSGLDFTGVDVGTDIFYKIIDTTTNISEIVRESFNNGSPSIQRFFEDDKINAIGTPASLTLTDVKGGGNSQRENKQLIGIEYRTTAASVDVANKANINFDNVSDVVFLNKGVSAGLAKQADLLAQVARIDANKAKANNNEASIKEITNDGKIVGDNDKRYIELPEKGTQANPEIVVTIPSNTADGTYEIVKTGNDITFALSVQTDNIKYFKGQLIEFIEEKVGTKFEDTTLFTKHLIAEGQAIVGGTDGSTTNGEVISHKHGIGSRGVTGATGTPNPGRVVGTNLPLTDTLETDLTGGTQNKAYGIKLLKVVYIAKKDIKESELI